MGTVGWGLSGGLFPVAHLPNSDDRRNFSRLAMGFVLLVNIGACVSDDGFTLYDDFTGTTINTAKWIEDADAGGTLFHCKQRLPGCSKCRW